MDINNGTTIIFIRRHKPFLTALFVGLLSCILLFQLSTSNEAYFTILSNNSKYTLFSITYPKGASPDKLLRVYLCIRILLIGATM